MASDLSNGHIPPSGDSPFMKLPEHIDGFIDVETLVDIHKYLSESENTDDVALATWVQENYLQEPLAEAGRRIRDTEGFIKLDRSYRRVRQLTGKAQDKWPFFDKNWKKMSSTVVKNAVLGDAGIGTTPPVINGEVHDSPMVNGFDGQHDYASQKPRLQAPSGAIDAARHQLQEQKSPQPADPSLADQQEPERKARRQAPDLSPPPSASSISGASARNEGTGTFALNDTANGTTPPVDLLRDAGAGKVRGPHGRYVNKSKPSPTTKKGPNIKYVKRSRTRAALEGESDEKSNSSDESVTAPKTLHALASGSSSDSDREVIQRSSEPLTDVQTADNLVNDSPVSSLLAAEAEAVPSNLDRLPPGFVGKKRKSESAVQRGGFKRARGSRGGVLGRPRKSEPVAVNPLSEAEEGVQADQVTSQPEFPAKAATRRSSRKSAISAVESSTPWNPADDVLLNGTAPKQADNNDDTVVTSVNGAAKGGHRSKQSHVETETSVGVDQKTLDAITETMNSDSPTAPANASTPQASKTQKAPAPCKRKKRVSFSPEIEADNVEFFARISTSAGTQEVSLSEEDLTFEVNLVKRYAAWQNTGNTNVTFEVFKNIAKFAR